MHPNDVPDFEQMANHLSDIADTLDPQRQHRGDTTEHVDHAAAIRDILSDLQSWHMDPDDDGTAADQVDEAMMHVAALANDLARVVAYARAVTAMCRETLDEDIGDAWHTHTTDDLDALIAEAGVTDLMRADDTPQPPGWSGEDAK